MEQIVALRDEVHAVTSGDASGDNRVPEDHLSLALLPCLDILSRPGDEAALAGIILLSRVSDDELASVAGRAAELLSTGTPAFITRLLLSRSDRADGTASVAAAEDPPPKLTTFQQLGMATMARLGRASPVASHTMRSAGVIPVLAGIARSVAQRIDGCLAQGNQKRLHAYYAHALSVSL